MGVPTSNESGAAHHLPASPIRARSAAGTWRIPVRRALVPAIGRPPYPAGPPPRRCAIASRMTISLPTDANPGPRHQPRCQPPEPPPPNPSPLRCAPRPRLRPLPRTHHRTERNVAIWAEVPTGVGPGATWCRPPSTPRRPQVQDRGFHAPRPIGRPGPDSRRSPPTPLDSRCTRGRALRLHRACPMSIGRVVRLAQRPPHAARRHVQVPPVLSLHGRGPGAPARRRAPRPARADRGARLLHPDPRARAVGHRGRRGAAPPRRRHGVAGASARARRGCRARGFRAVAVPGGDAGVPAHRRLPDGAARAQLRRPLPHGAVAGPTVPRRRPAGAGAAHRALHRQAALDRRGTGHRPGDAAGDRDPARGGGRDVAGRPAFCRRRLRAA